MAAQAAGAAFEKDIHHDPKQKPQKVCVLGGGNFGTAMAFLAASKSHSVRWYCRDAKQAAIISSTRRRIQSLFSHSTGSLSGFLLLKQPQFTLL